MELNLLQNEKCCYITGKTVNLHRHHVFQGSRRKASEKWGCWVYLTADMHNMSNKGVHFNRELDLKIKKEMQEAFEKVHGHDKFMEVFGKNYL